jgi:ribosomal protein S18 acetylase RimI-like enzyme
MPAEHFGEFAKAAIDSYAADNVASGRWRQDESEQLAQLELSRLLPQAAKTSDHYIYEIKLDAGGPVLGFVWFGTMPRGTAKVAFVFQLFIQPEYRRQGHGRAALTREEQLAADLGLPGIALNVFGSNLGAQALYQSLGYAITSLSMHKAISSSDVA